MIENAVAELSAEQAAEPEEPAPEDADEGEEAQGRKGPLRLIFGFVQFFGLFT